MKTLPINVLDLAARPAGGTNAEAVAGSIRLAQAAENLGYDRFWVAEHHNMPAIASSAPPVLIAGIAARTERIRVGSGGVMLPNHAPLVVAEQFGTLRALYGDRIDLGIGRAPGTDGATAMALRRSTEGLGVDDFPQQLVDLIGFFHGGMDEANPMRTITAYPGLGDAPQMWLLGSSGFSAQVAAALGLPFAFAHHFAGENTEAALAIYRERFEPSRFLTAPHTMIAVGLVSDDDPEVVRRESLPGLLTFLRMRQGHKPEPVSIAEALAYEFSPPERDFIEARNRRQAVGTPAEVDAKLTALLESTGADELMLSSQASTLAGRIRSLEIVAALRAPAPAPAPALARVS
ncbi:LLM class flavin-dependent oxidoreductase [Cryobacterium sp. Sr8]|uniref:LLM class flavin-dependent oxidoreductase n=1 Tax=unclassified Cryobacterium TaxID=2649013 RepID=UPI00106CF7FA|nr:MULTISPECIES: LLM class flavin-dependent oxidoreductase [unclassified Cryobacterium]TFD42878.1 LLM class flavin-dependent oxidoreductase [Cryobacterium sp. TMT1-2-1]TFD79367.1 LLM class flavin-dependent oxidoreductase [Cryobacterium sp. Sr8]